MRLCIGVGAAIPDHDQPIIQIDGLANGRQNDAAGVDTGEHSLSMPLARSSVSKSVPTNGLTRCLTTIGSPSRAAADGWIAAPSLPATSIPFAFTTLNTGIRGLSSGWPGRNATTTWITVNTIQNTMNTLHPDTRIHHQNLAHRSPACFHWLSSGENGCSIR
jgi:hypothetical protein